MKRPKNIQVGCFPCDRPMYRHTMEVYEDGVYLYSTRAYRTLKDAVSYAKNNPVSIGGRGIRMLKRKVTACYKK